MFSNANYSENCGIAENSDFVKLSLAVLDAFDTKNLSDSENS